MFEVSGVRTQQAFVLSALRRHPGRSITVASLAAELNQGLAAGVPEITHEDVECTLAALLLRPELKALISFTTRPVAAEERSHRLSLGHAVLASTVLLSACAAPFGHMSSKPNLPAYFGVGGTVPRIAYAAPTSGTPEYSSAVIGCGDQLCLAKPTSAIASRTPKTLPSSSAVLASNSYFDYSSFPGFDELSHPIRAEATPVVYPPRAESELWSPSAKSNSVQPALLAGTSLIPVLEREIIDLPSSRQTLADLSSRVSALLVAPALDGVPAEVDHFLVTFRNGSQLLTDQAHQQAFSIAAALAPSDKVELRGRVGKTTISPEDAKLAVARAIAVRKQLVALGFSEKNIRIRLPKSSDLLDRNNFDAPVNMSVSVFRTPGESNLARRTSSPSKTA